MKSPEMILKSLLFLALGLLILNINLAVQNPIDSNSVFEPAKTSGEIGQSNIYQPDKPTNDINSDYSPLSNYEFYLSLIVLGFGIIALFVEILLIIKKKINQDNTIKFIIITLIVTATLFLITAGYSNDQIAPAVGLLGTIAGYLLGKSQGDNKPEANNNN